ncbi:MAG TPA: hypothetical protein VG225_01425 [Terracidiphilus sp.]|jgi:hypothetical protein|nr:hypothetical protein [Terracidiphilus sp.]
MPVSNALRRLLRVRDLEEEQQRLALESALGELHRLENALAAARLRERQGRRQVALTAGSSDATDRRAGIVETETARSRAAALKPRIAFAEGETLRLRQAFLEKRVERRQAETLIREAEALDAVEAGRRDQQRIDDWFGARRHGSSQEEQPAPHRPECENLEPKSGKAAAERTGTEPKFPL